MDTISGNTIPNKNQRIYVYGSPKTETAIYGKAITLNGRNQYIDLGKTAICRGNGEGCLYHGFTMRSLFRANEMKDYSYLTSSAPFDVYFKNK